MLADTRNQELAVKSFKNLYAEIAINAGAKKIKKVIKTDGLPKKKIESKERIATQGGVGDELPIPT
jgi:outer membrane protein assembly factor BamD (BamD/ComL family)